MYANLPANVIVGLPHPRRGDTHGPELFLTPSAGEQTRTYDTECSKRTSLTINPKAKGDDPYQDEMVSHIYKFTRNVLVRLSYPQ